MTISVNLSETFSSHMTVQTQSEIEFRSRLYVMYSSSFVYLRSGYINGYGFYY